MSDFEEVTSDLRDAHARFSALASELRRRVIAISGGEVHVTALETIAG